MKLLLRKTEEGPHKRQEKGFVAMVSDYLYLPSYTTGNQVMGISLTSGAYYFPFIASFLP